MAQTSGEERARSSGGGNAIQELRTLSDEMAAMRAEITRQRNELKSCADNSAAIRKWLNDGSPRRAVRAGALGALGAMLVLGVLVLALLALAVVVMNSPADRAVWFHTFN